MRMNILIWRSILGKSQKEMAKEFNISQQAYGKKERGLVSFTDTEKIIFRDLLRKYIPDLTCEDIFFNSKVLKISTTVRMFR